jgi:RNA polymerase sigma factor (sigma-70 family)
MDCMEEVRPVAMNDLELLRQYQTNRSEEAFRALINQYMGMVYASCRRQLGDRHMAEDATQAVFVLLSAKARSIRHSQVAGWLLITARYTCAKIKKMEMRRRRRETAVAMDKPPAPDSANEELLALLDDGLSRLRDSDRQAIALRYLQGRSIREAAEVLGISEQAARKRVDRSVGKLRDFFVRKGISVTAGALPVILGRQTHAAELSSDAQASMVHGILSACHGGAAASPAVVALARGANMMMRLHSIQSVAAAALIAMAVLAGSWWSARQVLADGAATAPAGNAVASPVADAAAPAPETDNAKYLACRHVLEAIIDSHDSDDAAAFKSQLFISEEYPEQARIIPILINVDMAVYRVQKAAITQFGAHAVDLRYYYPTSVMTFEDVLSRIERKDAIFSDDTGSLTPAEPFFPRAGIWPHSPIYFRKVDGVWKLDVNRTGRIQFKFTRRVPVPDETQEQAMAAAETLFVNAMNRIADSTASGQIENAGDLQRKLDGAIIGVALTFSNFSINVNPK